MKRACCLTLGLLISTAAQAEPTWKLIEGTANWNAVTVKKHKDAGNVTVQSQTIGGVPCFRAIAETSATPDIMLKVATDIKGTLKWSTAGLTRSEMLADNGNVLDYLQ